MSLFAGASIKHIFSLPPKLASHPQKAEQPLPKGCPPLRLPLRLSPHLPLHLPHSLPLLAVCFSAAAAVSTVLLAGYLIALLFARLRYRRHYIPASLAVTPPPPPSPSASTTGAAAAHVTCASRCRLVLILLMAYSASGRQASP